MIKLKNGIRLIFVKNNQKYINVDFAYRVGNKDENENQRGFAHLLEHLFLRSTKNKKYSTIINELEQYGSQINACTKQEFTHFFMDCLTSQFKNSFNLFLDLLSNDFYDKNEYVKTINIINEEVELYRKSPIDILKDTLNKNIYNCGMKNSITDRKFEGIPNLDAIKDFKNKYYCNNNLVVTVSGKTTFAIRKYIIDKLSLMKNNEYIRDDDVLKLKESTLLPSEVTTDKQFIVGKRYIHYTNSFEDFLKLKILGKLLGGSISSRLFTSLREDRGLIYSVYSYSDMFTTHSSLTVITHVGSDKYKETISLLEANLSKDKLSTINTSEFDKAKTLLCLNFAKEFSINNTLAQFVSECYSIYFLQLNYKELIKHIQNIRYNEFIDFCSSLNDNWYNSIVQY
ncbi:MAG: insulinase family protein [Clostridia bacterium]|nr:insulinase family protein [Clostridia bacterium]